MPPSIDIFDVLLFVGFAQALFWVFALLGLRESHQKSNRILATLLAFISLGIGNSILNHTKYIWAVPHLIGVVWPLSFVYPPLFYLYVRSLTNQKANLKKQLLHFVPAIVCAIYVLPFWMQSSELKKDFLMNAGQQNSTEATVFPVLIVLQEVIYITLSLILVARHSRQIKNECSTLQKTSLHWIRNLIGAYILITIIFIFARFVNSPVRPFHVGSTSVAAFVFALGYLGLRQPVVFSSSAKSNDAKKYQKSGLTEERADRLVQRVLDVMQTEKPFVQSDLTLQDLAKQLSVSTHHLSQLLNESLGRTFFDFVNSHRVEEAKKQLHDPQNDHLTILAIAYQVGFNSKSHFNLAFKKHAGMTPTQFRNQNPQA
jgi:AraC-like DNA-binding protein